jgi:predicted GNAT family N-acyltransferase
VNSYPITEPLAAHHLRKGFSCGEASLDTYIKQYARQDQKRSVAAVFVLADESQAVMGYYTLSSLSIPTELLSETLQKRLPRHQYQPATLLGRLAVDEDHQGTGMGEKLLLDALHRSFLSSKEVGSIAVVVDALHDQAAAFYQHYGFIPFTESRRLFLPMQTIAQLF